MTPDAILDSLTDIANNWKSVAVFWHVVGVAMLVSTLAGPFLSRERLASILAIVPASVAVFAWLEFNVFNGSIFVIAAVTLLLIGAKLAPGKAHRAHPTLQAAGASLMLFALVYPHFVEVTTTWQYLLYAPVGLLPCPTLALIIGVSIMLRGFDSRAWSFVLAGVGLFYGLLGALWLGVQLDWGLVGGAVALLLSPAMAKRATSD